MPEFPLQLVILSVPALLYLVVLRHRREPWKIAFLKIGWQSSDPVNYLLSLITLIIMGGLGWLALRIVPAQILQDPNLNISAYQGISIGFTAFLSIFLREAIYTALGEEIFFRGWLGGWLVRRFGFFTGNLTQALLFFLPHLVLLTVSINLWPVVAVQFLAGWMLGWLRYRSNSILPGWVAHSLINTLGAFASLFP